MRRRGKSTRRRHSTRYEWWWIVTGFGFAGFLIGALTAIAVFLFMHMFDLLPWWVSLMGGIGIGGMAGTSYVAAMEDISAEKWHTYHIYRIREPK